MADFWSNISGGRLQQGTFQIPGTNFYVPDAGLTERFNTGTSNPNVLNNGAAFYQPQQGQVLPSNTSNPYQYNQPIGPQPLVGPLPNNNNNTVKAPQNPVQVVQNTPQAPTNDLSNIINSGYDSYLSQLDAQLNNDLPSQRDAQSGILQSSFDQGVSTLGSNKNQQLTALELQQKTSLKDLNTNVRNLFNSGNNYLGTRGAADSSAADQYSYAVTKLATKERGGIMSQINQRKNQIGDIYNQEVQKLTSDFEQKKLGIAQWFSEAQQQVRQMIGQGQLSRKTDLANLSQQLYSQALNEFQRLQAEQSNQRQQLQTWALNNSQNVEQVISTLSKLGVYEAPQMNTQAYMPQVTSEGQYPNLFGFSSSNKKKTDEFGNTIG